MFNFSDFFQQDTNTIAQQLLGMQLNLNNRPLGKIVEVESYLGALDSASHSYHDKRTPKNEAMYLSAGHWYVYQIYGHQMLNLVTRPENVPEAILIRALELPAENGNGPGKLTKACQIDQRFNGKFWKQSALTLKLGSRPKAICRRPRIGVTCKDQWRDAELNFYVCGHSQVSKIKKSEIFDDPWL